MYHPCRPNTFPHDLRYCEEVFWKILLIIDKMLTNKKFKDFFAKNAATL